MKRALLVLLLVVSCSHSDKQVAVPSPTPSPTPSVTQAASPTPTVVARTTPPPVARPAGPVGTAVPKGFVPQSASFISDTDGWVLGASPCPSGTGRCDVIARTRDGARTWKAIPSPRTSPDHLAQVRFADAVNGFVTGDQLWATHDRGATWRVVPGIGDVQGIAAAHGRVWVLRQQTLRSAPVSGGPFVNEQSDVLGFWLQGSTVVFSRPSGPALLVTRHGGGAARQLAGPCAHADRPIAGLGTEHWIAVCAGEAGLGHEEKTAYRSTDQGARWTPLADPPGRTGTDLFVTTDGDALIDHQEVSVLRAGTWKTSLESGGGIGEGGFESARMGFCIGGFGDSADQAMQVSRDAGRTWGLVAF